MTSDSTPHAPLGAHARFDFGPVGESAGFIPSATTIGYAQNVFVGCRRDRGEPWSLLPFFTVSATGPQPLAKGRYGRFLAWAGDKWMIGPLVFKLCTPFSPMADPTDNAFRYAPVVCGYLEYDNTHSGDTAELVFGLGGAGRQIEHGGMIGVAFADSYGFATTQSSEGRVRHDGDVLGADAGVVSALRFAVPPHEKRLFPLVLGFFKTGFYYTRFFPDLRTVLGFGLDAHARYLALADARDAEFMRSPLPLDARMRAALEVRRWLAQTRRLADEPEINLLPLREICRAVTD